jgi:hypothetical protein
VGSGSGGSDASRPGPEDDGGSDVAGGGDVLSSECDNVEAVKFIGEDTPAGEFVNAIAAPSDLEATRVVTTWSSSCSEPVIRVVMSDGRCPDGSGHELTFYLSVNDIESGNLALGQNLVREEPFEGLRVRYNRPEDFEPAGEWGTCADAEGYLDLLGSLDLRRDTTLNARFLMSLTPCDGSDGPVQSVEGTFNAKLRRGLQEVCPGR